MVSAPRMKLRNVFVGADAPGGPPVHALTSISLCRAGACSRRPAFVFYTHLPENGVILSKRSASKDLRTIVTAKQTW